MENSVAAPDYPTEEAGERVHSEGTHTVLCLWSHRLWELQRACQEKWASAHRAESDLFEG